MSKLSITFLTEVSSEEMQNINLMVDHANKIICDYYGVEPFFDILLCKGDWEMEVQVLARKEKSYFFLPPRMKLIGMTDYRLQEIVIRLDVARFGHYLHELIHSIMNKNHPHQLKEALAWYFTEKLTERSYVKAHPPLWVETIYIKPAKRLARIVGDDFLRDLALGKAAIEPNLLPEDITELFMPEELFYSKKRYET